MADRMMELTGTVEKREMKSQLLDSMDLERERGITIKLAPVSMLWREGSFDSADFSENNFLKKSQENFRELHGEIFGKDEKISREKRDDFRKNNYELNLIDTPGHVDFSYEVSRSLAAVEGAILVVDATQGIQAQTLQNLYLAMDQNLEIIPVLNKIDLPAADVEKVSREIINLLGVSEDDILKISAKTGDGVAEVLDAVVSRIPAPRKTDFAENFANEKDVPLRALIFDSYYDDYRGVILYVRIVDGRVAKGDEIFMMATEKKGLALEIGKLSPKMTEIRELGPGEIGYIVTNLKTTRDAKVGDTVNLADELANEPLPGYKEVKPFVYAGFFPTSNEDYGKLKDAVEKISLSDSALQFAPENSPVLGFGVRIGFLGLLHLDIIRERLEREYGLDLIVTNPSTDYEIVLSSGEILDIKSASELPDQTKIREIREPWVNGEIIVPREYVGAVLNLIITKRGMQKNISYIEERSLITFSAPLANLLTDFYDQLKSVTSGYGSFNYDLADYKTEDLVRVDFLIAEEIVDALSVMCHRSEAAPLGRELVKKLRDVIPRQNFVVKIQATIGGKIIARETISAYRKDVTVKIHTGDPDRRAKLLDKQKRGKKRMRKFGKVEIPSEAFTVMLKKD